MKKLLVLLGVGLGFYAYFKRKSDAFDSTSIKLAAIKFTSFSFPTISSILTVDIANPSNEKLFFTKITGVAKIEGTQLSAFNTAVGAEIAPNATTKVDVNIDIDVKALFTSIVKFIQNAYKGTILIDSVTTISDINIPVRQVFPIDLAQIAALGKSGGIVNQSSTPTQVTPTLIQPDILLVQGVPSGYIAVASNASGEIDPTGGAVITLINKEQPNTITTDIASVSNANTASGKLLVINPDSAPVQSFSVMSTV